MATAWSMTARQIVQDALTLLGASAIGETVTGDLYLLSIRTLNGVMKELALHGYTWPNLNVAASALAWSGGTPSYVTAPADFSSDLVLARTDANGSQTPMTALQRAAWLEVPNKAATGSYPTHFYADVDGKVYLWPVPTQDPGLRASYIQKPDDVVDAQAPDFPASGALALVWGLAAHMAPHFQIDPALYAATWGVKRADLLANGVNTAPVIFELID